MSVRDYNIGDRFIPRRKGVNYEASRYRILQNEEIKDKRYLDVFQEITNATQNWRKKKMGNAFKAINIFKGLNSNRVMNIGTSSTIGFKNLIRECSYDDYAWDCRARKQPLINSKGENYESQQYRDHGAQIYRLAYSIRFRNLIDWGKDNFFACGLDDEFYICRLENVEVYKIPYSEYVCNVKWSPDGVKIAVSGLGGSTSLFYRTCIDENYMIQLRWTVKCQCNREELENPCSVTYSEWSKVYNHILLVCDNGRLSIRRPTDGKLVKSTVFSRSVYTISLSPTELYLVVSIENKTVVLFDYPSLTVAFKIKFDSNVKAFAWHPWKANILCIGGGPGDGSLSLWNVSSQRRLAYREVNFLGSVEHLMFNRISGELLVHWYYMDDNNSKMHSKIVILSSLDKIVDVIPIHPNHRVLTIVWDPSHKRLALQHRDAFVIWDFFGSNADTGKKKSVEGQAKKKGTVLQNYNLEPSTSVNLVGSLATSGCGKSFSYYNIR